MGKDSNDGFWWPEQVSLSANTPCQWPVVGDGLTVMDRQPAFGKGANRQRIKFMFFSQYPCCQRFCRVISQHRDFALGDHRAFIHAGGDEMDAAAMFRITGIQRPLMRM